MRKKLKRIGIGILTTALVVGSVPSGTIYVKAETGGILQDADAAKENGLSKQEDNASLGEEGSSVDQKDEADIGQVGAAEEKEETNADSDQAGEGGSIGAGDETDNGENTLGTENEAGEKAPDAGEVGSERGEKQPEADDQPEHEGEGSDAEDGKQNAGTGKTESEEGKPDAGTDKSESEDGKTDAGMDQPENENDKPDVENNKPENEDGKSEAEGGESEPADDRPETDAGVPKDEGKTELEDQKPANGSSEGEADPGKEEVDCFFAEDDFARKSDGSIVFSLKKKEVPEGNYCVLITSTGNSRGYQILTDGKAAAFVKREPVEAESLEDTEAECMYEDILTLTGEEQITIRPSDGYWEEKKELTGKIISVELLEMDDEPVLDDAAEQIWLSGEDWFPGKFDETPTLQKKQWIDFMILERDGFEENNYIITATLTGTRQEYLLQVNGVTVGTLSGKADSDGPVSEEGTITAICPEPIFLKPGDILTVYAASGENGFPEELCLTREDAFELPLPEEADSITYEAEDYYSNSDGIQTDGDVAFCDMQPGESITIPVKEPLKEGSYKLSISSNGTRMGYTIYLNGIPAGVVKRSPSGWSAADLTDDEYEGILTLKPGDTIQIQAPVNQDGGDNSLYGKLNSITLTAVEEEPEIPEPQEVIELQSSDWYFGTIQEDGYANLRPGDQIDYIIRREDGFEEEEASYKLAVQTGGFAREYIVKVNSTEIGRFSHMNESGDWNAHGTAEPEISITLKAGDVLSICAEENYGTIGSITLTRQEEEVSPVIPPEIEGYVYEAEDYYGNADRIQTEDDVTFCDMQPGESITIPVDDQSLEEGNYQLSIASNGTRTGYTIYINGNPTGVVKRSTTGFGVADLTEDEYEGILTLKPGDTIQIQAPINKDGDDNQLFGKLDSIKLTATEEEPEIPEVQEKVTLESSDWYFGTIQEDNYANLRPGDQIDYMIRREDGFSEEETTYQLTARTGGFAREYIVKINGTEIGRFSHENELGDWGVYNITELEDLITLKAGDILTISAEDGYGTVGTIMLTQKEKEDVPPVTPPVITDGYVYEAEDYYGNADGIQTEDDVTFCDMQPGESITIPVDDQSLEEGNYVLSITSNGTRTGYTIYVNGEPTGVVKRNPTGWGAADLSEDEYEGILTLKPGDTIQIQAPVNKNGDDNQLFGKSDSIRLTATEEEPEIPEVQEKVTLESSDWYFGTIQEDNYANLRPGDQIDYMIRRKDGFSEEETTYQLIARTGGFAREYVVKINGTEIGRFNHENELGDWGVYNITELEDLITLKAGDILTISAEDNYGTVGTITLTHKEKEDVPPIIPPEIEGYVYEAEDYYGNADGIQMDGAVTFCDMQPGESITIPVDDQSLEEGNYQLSITSNGTRTGYAVSVNGIFIGTVKRGQTGWGAADLTEDEYDGILALKPGDVIQVKAPSNKWEDDGQLFGKLDCITLNQVEEEPELPGVLDEIVLHSEDWYFGKQDDAGGVNLRPQDQIDYAIRMEDGFAEEETIYQMSVEAGGFRTAYTVKVNGTEIGSFSRPNTEWGELNTTVFPQLVKLKAGDVLSICADESWGTVAAIQFTRLEAQDPFQAVDAASHITVSAEPGIVPAGSILVVEAPDEQHVEQVCQTYGMDRSQGTFYQITLKDPEGNEVQPFGAVTVTVPLSGGADSGAVSVFQITEDGRMELVDTDIQTDAEQAGSRIRMEVKELGAFGIFKGTAAAMITLEAENFYANQDGIQKDGAVTFCDMQPGETIDFKLPKDLKAGYYHLIVTSNGTRTAYQVAVDGTLQAVVKRGESGWGAADLTRDYCRSPLKLEAGSTLSLTASLNKNEGDGMTFGKLDSITLIPVAEPEIPSGLDEITLSAEDWYGGTKDSSGGMNIRPDDSLELAIRELDGFTEGDYVIAVKAGGFRNSYTVKVNGETVMELPVRTCEWGLYLTGTAKQSIYLKPGDVLTVYAAESWGCIDTIIFYKGTVSAGTSMEDRRGGRAPSVDYSKSAGEKASGTEPVFIYQGEGYYMAQSDNPAADLQPGEQIEIPLSDNPNFVDGLYQITIVSCGTRDHFFVKVNGQKTGRIDRKPGSYGMDQMSHDTMTRTVNLKKGDLLCIEAAPSEWGWVDYIQLDLIQKAETQTTGKRYSYAAMNYYSKKQADSDTADLQPGEQILIPIQDASFEEGYYLVSATSCGGRQKMSVEINGQEAGWIRRNSNSYGVRSLVRDTMSVPVYLKYGDQLAICAPSDGGWAWVGNVDLIQVQ